ncbi:transcription initiation factor IIF subunit beta [Ceratobasidium sp. AG-Ba]|nr:transcription initiation factor IIF subunit beta [Ceratobasidium sp. AG-Ba]QRV89712.1 transcription initiation factor IIF subunit beta [Ceratobasidium sp. AG-Ba]QRW03919.1 transcription initiation factor IIF subunit beta [Ceratobasidium sp. AG-Ba]
MDYDDAPRGRASDLDSNSDSDDDGPNEDLVLRGVTGTVWLVKVPRTVMEAWTKVDEEGKHLATLRVYEDTNPPVIHLILADDPSLKENLRGAVFTLSSSPAQPKNMFVISEPTSSQPDMQYEASVGNQWQVQPTLTQKWTRNIDERNREANVPKRQLIQIDDGNSQIKKIASGAGHLGNFSNLVKQKPKPATGQFERAARIPKNELLDMLFKLFRSQSHWSMKVLRERTKQPLDYLKETLEDIATLHKSGPHTNTWSLQPSYAQQFGAPEEASTVMAGPSIIAPDSDEEDDDDLEMEEIA